MERSEGEEKKDEAERLGKVEGEKAACERDAAEHVRFWWGERRRGNSGERIAAGEGGQ